MGSLFRAPKPVIVQAPAVAATASSPAAAVVPATATPNSTTAPSAAAEQAASDARIVAQQRAERGLSGTIATTARGVFDPWSALPLHRKSLLGE